MNLKEFILYTATKNIDRLFEVARSLPADKLDWKPAPGARSALDQLQEVVTALDAFLPGMRARVVTFDQAEFAKWMEERSKITSLDELEKLAKKSIETLKNYLDELSEEDLDLPVQMPFPGSFKVADMVDYHTWNSSYHYGQISYIASLLEPNTN